MEKKGRRLLIVIAFIFIGLLYLSVNDMYAKAYSKDNRVEEMSRNISKSDGNEELIAEDQSGDYYFIYEVINDKAIITKLSTASSKTIENLVIPDSYTDAYSNITYPVTSISPDTFYGYTLKGSLTIGKNIEVISESNFSGQTGLTGILTIPSSVKKIEERAFEGCGFTGKLIIPDTVESIGAKAFKDCTGFTELELGRAVNSIGNYAFSGCTSFKGSLNIGDNIKNIGDYCFSGCTGFDGNLSIGLADMLGKYAFKDCTGFTGYLSVHAKAIGDYAFSGCKNLTGNLRLGSMVNSIGQYAFYGCSGLTGDILIPDSVTSIGKNAFYGCTGFNGKLKIGNGLKLIDDYTFRDCNHVKAIEDMGQNVEAVNTNAFKNMSAVSGNLIFPDSVKVIGSNVAQGCTGLEGLTFGENVEKIDAYAFNGLSNIKGDIILGDKLLSIGDYAFAGCSELDGKLKLGRSLKTIGNNAFSGCGKLMGDLIIPDTTEEIGEYAFYNCSGFDGKLVLGSGVSIVKSNAFAYCSGFKGELILGKMIGDSLGSSLEVIESRGFLGCSSFTDDLLLPNTLKSIGMASFSGCSGFTGDLVIPDTVENMGEGAFLGCSGFDGALSISNSLDKIANNTFKGCTGLTGDLYIPDSVKDIGYCAFNECSGFTGKLFTGNNTEVIQSNAFSNCTGFKGSLTFGDGLRAIKQSAFSGDSGFTGDLQLPATLDELGASAFCDCTGFDGSLIIKELLTDIGDSAFYNCKNFKGTLNIPATVNRIGVAAFAKTGFSAVYIPNSVETIEYGAFSASKISGKVTIPASVKTMREDAFEFCSKLTDIVNNSNSKIDLSTISSDKRFWIDQSTNEPVLEIANGEVILKNFEKDEPEEPSEGQIRITFDYGFGELFESKNYMKDDVYLDLPIPTRDGYSFAGWFTSPDQDGQLITEGSRIEIEYDHTLYAKWEKNGQEPGHIHTPVKISEAIEATCSATGLTEGKKCSECGEILESQVVINKKEHSWDAGISYKKVKTYTCTVCGATKEEADWTIKDEREDKYLSEKTALSAVEGLQGSVELVVYKDGNGAAAKIQGIKAVIKSEDSSELSISPAAVENLKKSVEEKTGIPKKKVDLEICVLTSDSEGRALTVTSSSKNLKKNAKLYVYAVDPADSSKYVMVDASSSVVRFDKNNGIKLSGLDGGMDYKLLSSKEASKAQKDILKTVALKNPKKENVATGTTVKLELSDSFNPDNLKSMEIKASKKYTVNNESQEITLSDTVKKGTVSVKIKITLKNGKSKTLTKKIRV